MTRESRVTMHKGAAVIVGLALVLTGAGASYLFMRSNAETRDRMDASPVATSAAPPASAARP